jgi:hypothetical protein
MLRTTSSKSTHHITVLVYHFYYFQYLFQRVIKEALENVSVLIALKRSPDNANTQGNVATPLSQVYTDWAHTSNREACKALRYCYPKFCRAYTWHNASATNYNTFCTAD